jgi:hypothetical protein
MAATTTVASPERRRAALAKTINGLIAQDRRIESQSDYQAVLIHGHTPRHILHFVIGLITYGVWWIGWLVITLTGGERREIVNVDEFASVNVQRLGTKTELDSKWIAAIVIGVVLLVVIALQAAH